jgi:hypothetical protein
MRLRISVEPKVVAGRGKELDAACELAWERISEMGIDSLSLESWTVSPSDGELVEKVRTVYSEVIPKYAQPVYEVLLISDLTSRDFEAAGFLVFGTIGDSASGLDELDAAEVGDSTGFVTRCGECENSYADPEYKFEIRGRRLAKEKVLF